MNDNSISSSNNSIPVSDNILSIVQRKHDFGVYFLVVTRMSTYDVNFFFPATPTSDDDVQTDGEDDEDDDEVHFFCFCYSIV